jgi:hypothetical protein
VEQVDERKDWCGAVICREPWLLGRTGSGMGSGSHSCGREITLRRAQKDEREKTNGRSGDVPIERERFSRELRPRGRD